MNFLDDLADSIVQATSTDSPWAVGRVTSVVAGAAADGLSLVTVTWQGAAVKATYLVSYTPTVGHVVLMARTGPRLVILGRIGGTPT